MKNLLGRLVALLIICVAGAYAWVGHKDAEVKMAVAAQAKAEALREKAEAEARKAEDERKKAEAVAKGEQAAAEKAKAEAESRKLSLEADKVAAQKTREEKLRLAEERKLQEERRIVAEAARDAEQAKGKIAEEERLKAEAQAVKAKEEADAQAAKIALVERSARITADALKVEELKKMNLDSLIAQYKEVNEILLARERETRPDRTLKDLLEEQGDGEEEGEGEDGAPTMPVTVKAKKGPVVVKSAGDRLIDKATAEATADLEDSVVRIRSLIVPRLEGEIRAAIRAGQADRAEALLKSLLQLVPDYVPAGN